MREASFYTPGKDKSTHCWLCSQVCAIAPGERGLCGVRENHDGTLFTLSYGRPVALNVDPIEKKPLYHFLPGSRSFSLGTAGCNFSCSFCQNADIAQEMRGARTPPGRDVSPEHAVSEAKAARCATIAYTYTEPTIFLEYALDCGRLAHGQGIRNVLVTNGYMTPKALKRTDDVFDAANVDLKAFSDAFYQRYCNAKLQPVLATIEAMRERGIWIEATTLVIPDANDDDEQLTNIARFLAGVDRDMPWHVSAFHPTHKLTDRPRTPPETLRRARDIGRAEGLRYVYTGNLPGDDGANTYCHECGAPLIERLGFSLRATALKAGKCEQCGANIPGVGMM